MKTITTRRATLADLDAVARLFDGYRQFYRQPSDLPLATNFIRERLSGADAVILVAEKNGRVVGFTQLYPCFSSVSARRIWILNDLFVEPQARGSGAGRSLLDAAAAFARETGALRIELETETSNTSAQRLYEAAGYEPTRDTIRYTLTLG
jgi:ribosomal protein S18 acetylase RimI-like enzyme